MDQFPSRLARRIVRRAGTDARVEELNAHLDELEANGKSPSLIDVGSIVILAIRSLPYRAPARSFLATYGAMMITAVAAWWVATWTGSLRGAETLLEEIFALQDFRFRGLPILFLFAAVAAVSTTTLVIATRTTVPRAYAMILMAGLTFGLWATSTGVVEQTEEFLSELFATDVRVDKSDVALWYAAITLPLVAGFVLLARQTFLRAYAMTLLSGLATVMLLSLTGTIPAIESFVGELAGVQDVRLDLTRIASVYAIALMPPIAVFAGFTKLAGRTVSSRLT